MCPSAPPAALICLMASSIALCRSGVAYTPVSKSRRAILTGALDEPPEDEGGGVDPEVGEGDAVVPGVDPSDELLPHAAAIRQIASIPTAPFLTISPLSPCLSDETYPDHDGIAMTD